MLHGEYRNAKIEDRDRNNFPNVVEGFGSSSALVKFYSGPVHRD
jgi:hypothetical protein